MTLGLLSVVELLLTQMEQRMQNDPFAHPIGEIVVDETNDRRFGQQGIAEHMIDAGAERKDRFEMRQIRERSGVMAPGERVSDRAAIDQGS